jgi:cytochrome c biogenesis protein CcmG, thiol:disulfide interchange protein DsbE
VFMGVLAVVGLLAFGLLSKGGSALAVGDPAPDRTLERLGSSGTGQLSDYRGSWTLVNFWASWCDPCRAEAPVLEAFWKENRDRVVVVGVDLDDTTADAEAFIEEFGLTYPQFRSPSGAEWRDDYGMTGFPESFLIDPEGRISAIRRGPVDERVLENEFEPLIRAGSTQEAG